MISGLLKFSTPGTDDVFIKVSLYLMSIYPWDLFFSSVNLQSTVKCYMYSFTLLILNKCLFSDCQHTNITITTSKLQKFRATSFKCPEGDLFFNKIFPTHPWMSKQKLLFLNLFVGIPEYNLPMLFYSAAKSPFSRW